MSKIHMLLRDIERLPSHHVRDVKRRSSNWMINKLKNIQDCDNFSYECTSKVELSFHMQRIIAGAGEDIDNPIILEALHKKGVLGMINSKKSIEMIISNGEFHLFEHMDYWYSRNKEFMLRIIRLQPSTINFSNILDDEIIKATIRASVLHRQEGKKFFISSWCDLSPQDNLHINYRIIKYIKHNNKLTQYCLRLDGSLIRYFRQSATWENILLATETFPEVVKHLNIPIGDDHKMELLRRNRHTAAYMDVGLATLNYKKYNEVFVFNISFKFF